MMGVFPAFLAAILLSGNQAETKPALADLQRDLRSTNPNVRRDALLALKSLPTDFEIGKISMLFLEDPDSSVRSAAATVVSQYCYANFMTRKFVRAFEDKSLEVRRAAMHASKHGNLIPQHYFQWKLDVPLRDPDVEIRLEALEAIRNHRWFELRLVELLSDPDMRIRKKALHLLGSLPSPKPHTIQAIQSLAAESEIELKASAQAILKGLEERERKVKESRTKMDALLASLDPESRARYEEQAGRRKKSEEPKEERPGLSDEEVARAVAAGSLNTMDIYLLQEQGIEQASAEKLIAMLADKSAENRWRSAEVLGELREQPAIPQILSLLEDDNARVRCEAMTALGKMMDARLAVPILKRVRDIEPDVRRCAIDALIVCSRWPALDVDILLPLLDEFLNDTDSSIQNSAALATAAVLNIREYRGDDPELVSKARGWIQNAKR